MQSTNSCFHNAVKKNTIDLVLSPVPENKKYWNQLLFLKLTVFLFNEIVFWTLVLFWVGITYLLFFGCSFRLENRTRCMVVYVWRWLFPSRMYPLVSLDCLENLSTEAYFENKNSHLCFLAKFNILFHVKSEKGYE